MPHRLSLWERKPENSTICWLSEIKFYCGQGCFSPYHVLMRHFRLSITANGLHLLTWCKVICRCLFEEADIQKATFRAGLSGLYEFTHMLFGLSNSRSSFCCLMVMCLGDQQFVTLLLYLDDICVFATTIDEMLDHTELVFKWLEEFNLKIKPKKCHFFKHSIVFLGHILYAEGISANPEKAEKVKNWPVPTNPKELQSSLGLASYYPLFYTKICCNSQVFAPAGWFSKLPKNKKSKKKEPKAEPDQNRQNFMWTGEHQEADDLLKACLTSAPVLAYPDFSCPFELKTDASLQGLGTILSQMEKMALVMSLHLQVGPHSPVSSQC